MFWVQGSPTDFTSAFIWISCVSLFYNRTNHTFILVTFDMAVPGNIPSLVINTFVALNIVLDKQWRIQLSFMCKHHHTVLSRSTAHFFKNLNLRYTQREVKTAVGGKKTKPPRYLQRSFCFLTVTFSSSVAVEFTGRKWDMTMRNCSKPISSREPTSFWCWFLYHNQNKPMYRLVLTNAISAFSCLFWLKKKE